MRKTVLLCAVAAVATVGTWNAFAASEQVPAGFPVNLTVKCIGNQAGSVVSAPNLPAASKSGQESFVFHLMPSSDSPEVTLEPKPGNTWPFDTPPPTIARNARVASGAISDGAAIGVVYYNIHGTCDGTAVTWDPGMRIDP